MEGRCLIFTFFLRLWKASKYQFPRTILLFTVTCIKCDSVFGNDIYQGMVYFLSFISYDSFKTYEYIVLRSGCFSRLNF